MQGAQEGSPEQWTTTEEEDQRLRSVKKHKRDGACVDNVIPSAMQEDDTAPAPAWNQASFAEVLKGLNKTVTIYIGEGEEDITDDLDMAEVIQDPLD